MQSNNYRRYRPRVFNFVLLFVVWILLTNTFTFGNVLLATLLAWVIPVLVGSLQTAAPSIVTPLKGARYVLVLLGDIIVANIVVAKQVLGPLDKLKPGFIAIPLELKQPLPITLLASTISLTPGTVSTEVSADNKTLYVHALNVESELKLIEHIKKRYETPLKEIFEC
jgi:multicomponent K+:H+ antiporter subunit E